MAKQQFYQQLSIEEARSSMDDYDDKHYKRFWHLLFEQLLINIQHIPFDSIIQNYLQTSGHPIYKTKESDSLFWLYRADRKVFETTTVYSFRFANACNPEFYKSFETSAHHLFISIPEIRHKYTGWYKYIGAALPCYIDRYLNIQRVVDNSYPHVTKLFINQKQERLDIQFNFYTRNERISLTFEPGYPEHRLID